jgi:hypothetical protein
MIVCPEAQIHLLVGQREVELVLPLRQGVRVGRRRPAADLLGHADRLGHRVHLRLVEVGDRFDVGSAVAVLDEESLIVLESIGGSCDRVVLLLGPEIFRQLSRALFHVGRRNDRQVRIQRRTGTLLHALGRLHDEAEDIQAGSIADLREHDFRFPARAELRKDRSNGGVALAVAAHRLERWKQIDGPRLDSESLRHELAQFQAFSRGIGLRHEQREHPLRTKSTRRKRRDQRAVDPPRHPDDDTAASQLASDDLPHRSFDARRLGEPIHVEHAFRKHPSSANLAILAGRSGGQPTSLFLLQRVFLISCFATL